MRGGVWVIGGACGKVICLLMRERVCIALVVIMLG